MRQLVRRWISWMVSKQKLLFNCIGSSSNATNDGKMTFFIQIVDFSSFFLKFNGNF